MGNAILFNTFNILPLSPSPAPLGSATLTGVANPRIHYACVMTYANCLRLASRSVRTHIHNARLPLTVGARPFGHTLRNYSDEANSSLGSANPERVSAFKKQRIADLRKAQHDENPEGSGLFDTPWPRLPSRDAKYRLTPAEFQERFDSLGDEEEVTIMGRVRRKRVSGSKLMFIDIVNEYQKVQIMVNAGAISAKIFSKQRFTLFRNLIQVGDHIAVTGRKSVTHSGEVTLTAVDLPELLSPTMEQIPEQLSDAKTRMQERHVDMLVNQESTDILRLRAEITRGMREHFWSKRFLEAQTPILSENAGGATARPFVTHATEFKNRDLAMRIAPELWLKRLVVGGIDRVFEIGPAFRNEGIDATHNPEFTMCEFYSAYTNLADLIKETEELIYNLAAKSSELIKTQLTSLPPVDLEAYKRPFRQVEFVPALEEALGLRLPKLSSENALPELLAVLKLRNINLPGETPTTLPKLLDRLAAVYIEPLSFKQPIFITHHPSCMSPLSKSFLCEKTFQLVSARAEFFVGGRELANMYEEENDPEAQRTKLANHQKMVNLPDGEIGFQEPDEAVAADPDNGSQIETDVDGETSPLDSNFLKALDYALPPTGGWGCGVERLVMLFSGAQRISDCLSFGSLKNVVGLSAEERKISSSDPSKQDGDAHDDDKKKK